MAEDPIATDVTCSEASFVPEQRRDGISGLMRLCNEEDYLDMVIESHLPFLDELVIVYNRCTDRTPEIAHAFQARYPDKIACYAYPYPAHPPSSPGHVSSPPTSPRSDVNYSNFALSRTTCRYCVKVDGDHIAVPKAFGRLTDWVRREKPRAFVTFLGINLWESGGRAYVRRDLPFCGTNGDIGFFPVDRWTRFAHLAKYSRPVHAVPTIRSGVAFFHIKGMKRDKGLLKYDIGRLPRSPRRRLLGAVWGLRPALLTWAEFAERHPVPDYLPDPATLGLPRARRAKAGQMKGAL